MTSEFATFQQVISGYTKHVEVGNDSALDRPFSELSISSLAIVNLIVDLEGALGISMPDEILIPEVFSSPATLWKALEPYVKDVRG